MNVANANLQKNAERRKDRYNQTAKEAPIEIGTNVLLKSHPQGRNKIQDSWSPTPYKVVDNLQDNVYVIQLADGLGGLKTVTRIELLPVDKGKDVAVAIDAKDNGRAINPQVSMASDSESPTHSEEDSSDENLVVEEQLSSGASLKVGSKTPVSPVKIDELPGSSIAVSGISDIEHGPDESQLVLPIKQGRRGHLSYTGKVRFGKSLKMQNQNSVKMMQMMKKPLDQEGQVGLQRVNTPILSNYKGLCLNQKHHLKDKWHILLNQLKGKIFMISVMQL